MATITGFFHGGITVSDMARALGFYRDGLGLEQEVDRILDAPYLRAVLGLESTTAEHAVVLAAVERGDGAAAVRHAQDHILGSFRLIDARETRP